MSRPRMGCAWMILKPVLTLVVFGAVVAIAAFPWTIPWPGRDTLTGEWVGELRSSSGPQAWLWVDLQIELGQGESLFAGRTSLGEEAVLCTLERRVTFRVAGYTTRWSGERVNLLLRPATGPPELRLAVTGRWDGRTLALREERRSLAETLGEADESAAALRWIEGRLRRGTREGFEAECAGIAGGR